MKHINPALCLDFYKSDHRRQYPEGTTLVVSNLTPRSGKHANVDDRDGINFFGLQYFVKEFLIETWNKGLIQYEAVQKWNGVLPQYMMGKAVPFISITGAENDKE